MYNYYAGSNPTSCLVPAPGTSNNGNVRGALYLENMSTDLSHTASYTYDGVNRLTHAQATGNATYNLDFDYKADGTATGQYGNMSCVRNLGWVGACDPLTFSASTNRITTDDYSYDAAGNLLFDNTQTYTWDAEGQLRTVTRSGVTTTFTHFASGPIAQRSQAGEVIDFLYDPFGSPIAHYNATSSRWEERYIRLGGRIIAYYGYGCPPFTRFFHADGLGSMRQATDGSGNYVESALEYPWGQTWVNNGNAWDQNFAGMPDRAIDLDLYLTGSRQLGIRLNRWLSPDRSATPTPVPYADFTDPQTLNLYAYAYNNPFRYVDRNGHWPGWGWLRQIQTFFGNQTPRPVPPTTIAGVPMGPSAANRAAADKNPMVLKVTGSSGGQKGGTIVYTLQRQRGDRQDYKIVQHETTASRSGTPNGTSTNTTMNVFEDGIQPRPPGWGTGSEPPNSIQTFYMVPVDANGRVTGLPQPVNVVDQQGHTFFSLGVYMNQADMRTYVNGQSVVSDTFEPPGGGSTY